MSSEASNEKAAPCPRAIEVRHLTKQFNILHKGGYSLKLAVVEAIKRKRDHIEPFVALNDVSFNVPHGQTLAVIGRNGSGKSTLLSLLARVYKPTSGSVGLFNQQGGKARVAPLLELGAGFHPELNGLENISFYGAVLGMSAREVKAKTEQIVEFAELKNKVDTRLHGWNSGSTLRLGFSIAVHTDPDILLVDEVLAVGDESFQNKCYARIAEMQTRGKTIVFVSHALKVVERVADRVLWIQKGVIQMDGDAETVVNAYREASQT